MTVVRAILLLTVHRDLGRVHIQHYSLLRIDGFDLANEFAVDADQAGEVLLLGQHLGLERLQARSQRRDPKSSPNRSTGTSDLARAARRR
jgi:hypothetical protein